jgi:uncharacterized protein
MRRIALLGFGLLIATTCRAAPASPESVTALFSLMNMDRTIAQSFDKMQALTRQSLASLPRARALTPEQRERFDAGIARVDTLMRDEMSWAKLEPEFVQIYASTFTQDEIDGQLAFYRTPAGQALITKTPQLTDRTLVAMQAHMQVLLPLIQQTMQAAAKTAPN